jgi:dolichol-phosphate mannosyltransferase
VTLTYADCEKIDLTIFIPAYLEAENLAIMLPEIKAAAVALTPSYEILVIDTQEDMDKTGDICRSNGVSHIHRRGGNSYGDAIRTAIAESRGAYILCMDADGSHSPSYFASMWAKRETYEIVIGSRYIRGGQTENPAVLIWMSNAVNIVFRTAFSLPAKDVTNSFRLYHRSLLTRSRFESDDFDILEEILIKATICHPPARIAEVPVTFGRRKGGESKRKLVQFAFGYLKTLQRLRKFAKVARKEMQGA